MGPFHILLDEDQMELDKEGIHHFIYWKESSIISTIHGNDLLILIC